jgi:hypothetical protein
VGKPLKKTHTWSGGTGVRTRNLPNVKCRARRLATVLGYIVLLAWWYLYTMEKVGGVGKWWENERGKDCCEE